MGTTTGIAWTDHTFNPWWGCEKVSPGCKHCYAEAFADGRMHLGVWGAQTPRRFFGDSHWQEPRRWNRAAEKAGVRSRVFCASMADVFEDRADLVEPRLKLFALIMETPWLDWQLLTKRPQNIRAMLPPWWLTRPRPNVWLGTTTENQEELDRRAPILLDVPAVVHFFSAEPLLGPLDLRGFRPAWVIIGGESGKAARPFDRRWAYDLLDQIALRGFTVPFVKQMGSYLLWPDTLIGAGQRLNDPHGADPNEWEAALRVQRFPTPYLGHAAEVLA